MITSVRRLQFGILFIAVSVMPESVGLGEGPAAWDHAKATAECTGLRVYSKSISNAIVDAMRHAPEESYPAVGSFVALYDKAYAVIDDGEPVSSWPSVNVQELVVHNGEYWKAFYEIRPADPLLMMFHSARYGCNGQASRTFLSEQIAVHTPVKTKFQEEMFRLLISGRQLMSLGDAGVAVGNKFAGGEEVQKAVDTYNSVLNTIPKHAFALFELAQISNTVPPKAGTRSKKQLLLESRRQDPFRIQAYQGSFSKAGLEEMMALRRSARPAWLAFQNAGTEAAYPFGKLVELSLALQTAGLHELALLTRQLVVARRATSYSDDDSAFIEKSLAALCPDEDFSETLNRFRDQVAPFSLVMEKPKR